MKLHLREIGVPLSDPNLLPVAPIAEPDDRNAWRDSTLDLERGLEVVELSVDIALADLPAEQPAR